MMAENVPTVGYCLRCQEQLNQSDRDDPQCRHCGLQFNPDDANTFRDRRQYVWWKFWFPGFFLAVASGVISYAICLQFGELGIALFFAVPVSVGAIIGYGTSPRVFISLLLGVLAIPAIVVTLVSMHYAGFFCGLTLGLIFFVPLLIGVLMGVMLCFILRGTLHRSQWDQRSFLPYVLLIALPYAVQAIECTFPRRAELATIRTELKVDATPQEAWDAIMFYEEVEHPAPWLLRLALPKPIRSVGNKQCEGEIVRCFYDRGYLVKRISQREEGRLLAFDVIGQHLHFERDVTLRDGSFEIQSTDDGQTRIVLTTRYERHLYPGWLWKPIEHQVVSTLHSHVLEGMRRHAKTNGEHEPPYIPRRSHESKPVHLARH